MCAATGARRALPCAWVGGAGWCVCPRCRPIAVRASPVRRAGAVFESVHVAPRAVVAVKLLFAIANEPGAEVESHALPDR